MPPWFLDDTASKSPKPPLPYEIGRKLILRSHIPPVPQTRSKKRQSDETRVERVSKTPIERCLLNPPWPGSEGRDTISVQIDGIVRSGDQHRSQLLTVRILAAAGGGPCFNLLDGTTVLAKFYDPLYFDHHPFEDDPIPSVNHEYTRECAAYSALTELQEASIPRFYGSFTLELPVNQRQTRLVRAILLEYISGFALSELDPATFSQHERQAIMKSIIDIESSIYAHNIVHRDLYPRNILLLNNDARFSDSQKVVLIDFGHAENRIPNEDKGRLEREGYLLPQPISPLLRWHGINNPQFNFKKWVDWEWQPWLEQEYGFTSDSITEHMQSLWLPEWRMKIWRSRVNAKH